MAAVAAAAVVLDEQEHRLLRRACSDVAAVLISEVVGAEVEVEVDAQVRALWAAQRELNSLTAKQDPYPHTTTVAQWNVVTAPHSSRSGGLALGSSSAQLGVNRKLAELSIED